MKGFRIVHALHITRSSENQEFVSVTEQAINMEIPTETCTHDFKKIFNLHYYFYINTFALFLSFQGCFSDVSVVTPIPDPPFDKLRGKLPYFLIFPNFGKSSDMDAAIFEKSNLPENANPRRVVHKQLLPIVVVVVDFVCLFILLSLFCLLLLLIF